MKQFVLFWLVFFCCVVITPSAWSDGGKAEFSIHLFQSGLPIEGAELSISSTASADTNAQLIESTPSTFNWKAQGQEAIKTNANGSVAGKLPPGNYRITIQTADQQYGFDLPLQADENIQILLTFYTDGREPLINAESSVAGVTAGTAGSAQEQVEQGDGTMTIQVLSEETKKPVKDVQVFLSGLKQKLRTDAKGQVKVDVPVGSYSVSLLHAAYSSQTKDSIKVSKDQDTPLTFSLTPAGVELAEYVVLEPFLAGTIASVIGEQKDSASVTTILGAEQFSRSGDSDVASALRRASGLTLVGGQFVFIRGLGERFSSTLVNGAAIPSPDPTRRVVPLDLFPTSILESVLVQKTYSADRPGEFAGGTLEMRTRGIPDEFFFNLSGQVGFNTITTFKKGLNYNGSNTDFLGYGNGDRAIPGSVKSATQDGRTLQPKTIFNPDGLSPEELEKLGEDLTGVWDINQTRRGPDGKLQAAIGDVYDIGDFRMGFIASGGWKQEFRNRNEIRRSYAASGNSEDDRLTLTRDFDVRRGLQEVQINGYGAAEIEYKELHRIFSKTMYLRQSIDEARIGQGFTDAEVFDIRRTRLKYFSNQLFLQQVGGEHTFDFLENLKVDWLYTNATAKRGEPNTREYRYDADAQNNFVFSRKVDSNQISFSNLTDKDESWRVDVELPIEFTPDYTASLVGGFIQQSKRRNSSIQRFNYFSAGRDARDPDILSQPSLESILQPDNIGPNGFQIRDVTRPTDSYNATQELLSYYGKMNLSFFDTIKISGGVRWEDNDQRVETFQSVANQNRPVVSELNSLDILPSVSATWIVSDKQQIRAGYSQTISRPDFRELSPAPFTDPSTNQETTGNPDLQQTDITSADLRWEYYLSPDENLLAGFFWKKLDKPIERITLAGPADLLTFQNAKRATVFGIELEILKNLDFVHPYLEDFYIGSNYTWSKSNVKLLPENLQAQSVSSRPLQGHSAHIFNFQVGYNNSNWGTQATLLYNISSKRIESAGILGAPDRLEQPFHQLDFVVNQNVNDWLSLRINMRNLFNDKVTVKQGGQTTRQFRRGRQFNLGAKISF